MRHWRTSRQWHDLPDDPLGPVPSVDAGSRCYTIVFTCSASRIAIAISVNVGFT